MKQQRAWPKLAAWLGVASIVGLGTTQLPGQGLKREQGLPTVQQVMQRYVQALGGRAAIFRHKSMLIREKLQIAEKNVSLQRVVTFKGRKQVEEITLPDGSRYQSGYDGLVAWEINPKSGAVLIQGKEAQSKARDADMYYPARILDYFRSMEVSDIAEFEGHTCYHLKGTTKWGIVNEHFYDTTSGLLVGYRFNSAWRGGAGEERAVFSDYQDFGGWRIPARVEHREPRRTVVEVVSSVTFDEVADSVFTLPDGVKALLGKGRHG
jgi:hypothetical protein